ncbi:DUF3800 domain-containing protein [Roseovarius sp.]|uniref:DUF3800 domain-containing protein n=1 Tax=Roseovarius sp. TaxID=1486281 RepID=UPI003A976E22
MRIDTYAGKTLDVFVDESIHDRGGFIVVAAVLSADNVQKEVVGALLDCGFDPARDEFKSSMKMNGNLAAQKLRGSLQAILRGCKIAAAVCPTLERAEIVNHIATLLSEVDLPSGTSIGTVYFDEGMKPTSAEMPGSAVVKFGCDSKQVAGIQLADCAAHLISTMLLEELGLVTKMVPASSVYGEEEGEIELAWTLWASIRHALAGGTSTGTDEHGFPEPLMHPFGLFVSPSCSNAVATAARKRLSTVWVGCIH